MKIKYDKEVDAIYLRFSDAEVSESDEDKPGMIIDYDNDGKIVGIELLDASQRTDNPASGSVRMSRLCIRTGRCFV